MPACWWAVKAHAHSCSPVPSSQTLVGALGQGPGLKWEIEPVVVPFSHLCPLLCMPNPARANYPRTFFKEALCISRIVRGS